MTPIAFLVTIPTLVRFYIHEGTYPWWHVLRSISPLVLFAGASCLPWLVRDSVKEHVWRHITFLATFVYAIWASLNWSIVWERRSEEWASSLILFLGMAVITQTWFTLAHILENEHLSRHIFTHQGGVAVLPSTLVAVVLVQSMLPDEAFIFARSILVTVPVVVAWCTIFFIAYTGFAMKRVTTHEDPGYEYVAYQGFWVAVPLLTAIETRASSAIFFITPLVSAILCQVLPPLHRVVPLGGANILRSVFLSVVASSVLFICFALYIRHTLAWIAVAVVFVVTPTIAFVMSFQPPVWILPFSIYWTYLGCMVLQDSVLPLDIVAAFAFHVLAFGLVLGLNLMYEPPLDAHRVPQAMSIVYDPPQIDNATHRVIRVLERYLALPRGLVASRFNASNAWLVPFFDTMHPSCPEAFRGVWYMEDNTMPMQLICVHHAEWTADGATIWNACNTTRAASVLGCVNHAFAHLSWTRITRLSDQWIATDIVSHLAKVHVIRKRLWIFDGGERDTLIRMQLSKDDKVVYQYKLRRIARRDASGNIVTTPFYSAFMRVHQERPFLIRRPPSVPGS